MIAGLLCLLTGLTPRWVGCVPSTRPRIYIANHSSHLDAPLIWASLPLAQRLRTRPVAAEDYWQRSWLRRWCAHSLFRAVLVDRQGRADRAIARMAAVLDDGESLLLFPEGSRRGDDHSEELMPFKPGLWYVVKDRPQVEVVPVYLDRLSRILPKGEWLPVPLLASATFGTPLTCAPGEGRDEFLQRAREALMHTREA